MLAAAPFGRVAAGLRVAVGLRPVARDRAMAGGRKVNATPGITALDAATLKGQLFLAVCCTQQALYDGMLTNAERLALSASSRVLFRYTS